MKYILSILLFLIPGYLIADNVPEQYLSLPKKELNCLVKNAYYEAFGEGETGVLLVNKVVFNRTKNNKFCKTIYERKQFSWTTQKVKKIPKDIYDELASLIHAQYHGFIDVPDRFKNIYYFHEKSIRPKWSYKKKIAGRYRNHIFYEETV